MRSLLKLFPLVAAASLSACSALDRIHNIGEAPAMQPVGNPAGTQIVAAIPAPKPIMHVDNSLWQPGAQSFFHDPRAMHVGDVITVNVAVADTAKLQNSTSRSRTLAENSSPSPMVHSASVAPAAWARLTTSTANSSR